LLAIADRAQRSQFRSGCPITETADADGQTSRALAASGAELC
jgi:hypothetical protein